MILSMRSGLAICVVLLAMASPAAGQEIRPTLDKIKETGVVQLGYRETSRPFSFRGRRWSAGRILDRPLPTCGRRAQGVAEAPRAQGCLGGGDAGGPHREARQGHG